MQGWDDLASADLYQFYHKLSLGTRLSPDNWYMRRKYTLCFFQLPGLDYNTRQLEPWPPSVSVISPSAVWDPSSMEITLTSPVDLSSIAGPCGLGWSARLADGSFAMQPMIPDSVNPIVLGVWASRPATLSVWYQLGGDQYITPPRQRVLVPVTSAPVLGWSDNPWITTISFGEGFGRSDSWLPGNLTSVSPSSSPPSAIIWDWSADGIAVYPTFTGSVPVTWTGTFVCTSGSGPTVLPFAVTCTA